MLPLRALLPLSLCLWAPLGQDPVRDAALLQRAAELARPGEPHARLARLVGDWDVAVVTVLPDGSERTDRGTATGRAQLGGRYVELAFGLATAGGELHALQVLGFHTLHQVYTSSWRDDHSTWSVECSGAPDASAPERLVLHGSAVDAKDPEGRPFRLELDLDVEGAVTVRQFDRRDGAFVLRQTQRWTRR